jgi:hypothetical protein
MMVAILPWVGVSHVTIWEVFENGATRSVMASVFAIVDTGIWNVIITWALLMSGKMIKGNLLGG